jgi:hypothetical protein
MDLANIVAGRTIASGFVENLEKNADGIALRKRRDDDSYLTWTYGNTPMRLRAAPQACARWALARDNGSC